MSRPVELGAAAPPVRPPHRLARNGGQRALTLRVIVSQEWATASEVAETVRRLWRDTARTDDILVVGRHGASREMPAWLRGPGTIRYTEQMAGESFIAARNRAAAHSAHDILVFTDANVQTPAEWVDLLLSGFADERVAAVGPAIVDMYDPHSKMECPALVCQWRRETRDKESVWDEARSTSPSRW